MGGGTALNLSPEAPPDEMCDVFLPYAFMFAENSTINMEHFLGSENHKAISFLKNKILPF